jgi:MraZ protein
MLIGEYQHTLDPKKRLAIPAKWRQELGKKLILTYGLDNCLFVYPLAVWKQVAAKLGSLSLLKADTRRFNRFLLAGAVEVEVDSLGRILVPDFLKTFAGLDSRVIMAGVHNRLEIWDETRWQAAKEAVAREADTLAEKLSELGLF